MVPVTQPTRSRDNGNIECVSVTKTLTGLNGVALRTSACLNIKYLVINSLRCRCPIITEGATRTIETCEASVNVFVTLTVGITHLIAHPTYIRLFQFLHHASLSTVIVNISNVSIVL